MAGDAVPSSDERTRLVEKKRLECSESPCVRTLMARVVQRIQQLWLDTITLPDAQHTDEQQEQKEKLAAAAIARTCLKVGTCMCVCRM